ncbi:complement decay-accelerating factor transmembrane isoform-like [Eublepharis macularius]|uniref:Complement decay-accelerating factor transmembrane isoform-like n=1 Tax=Eublepharis macularius TaxID=481883 RepID=A0AA97JD22_EUBMA|nr:complement decay-accelerating factor transmembrane isoform-like [Eublepharis macularius]
MPPCRGAFLAALLLVFLSEARGDCNPPEPIRNAALKQEPKPSYPAGTELTYTCISGYEYIPGKRPVIRCLDTSEWSQVDVFCRGKRCPTPDIGNGHIVEDSELRLGDQITFACYEGYRPVGRTEARCVLSGSNVDWNSRPPHCERVPCYPPPEIANGRHNGQGDSYTYGSAVTYQCDREFSLIGNKTIVCTVDKNLNGKWSGSAPQCKDEILLPSSGPNVTSTFPTYTSSLPTLQTELAWEKLFIILQEIKDLINIKTKSFEERLDGLEKKVDKVIYEMKSCCQQSREERLEEEEEEES